LPIYADDLPTIDIVYNGNQATVTIPSSIADVYVNSTAGSPNVDIYSGTSTTEYCYRISGTTTAGSLTIQGNYKLTLELAGVDITSSTGAAINIECGKRIDVILDENTTNTLSDCSEGTQKAALYFTGHPEFKGAGTLNVTGNTKHAISAKEYLILKSSTGTINVLGAVSDGIHCGKGKENNDNCYFQMKGGTVNIEKVGNDCIDSDDYGNMFIEGGELNLSVSTDGGAGLKCDSILYIEDGDVNISLTGSNAEGVHVNHTAYFNGGDISIYNSGAGSKGIKINQDTLSTVVNGGFAYFNGTDINITLTGINYTDGSRCMGIGVDQNMKQTDGDITISLHGEQPEAYNIKGALSVEDLGRLIIEGDKNKFSLNDFQYDMSLYFTALLEGVALEDYSNYQFYAVNNSGTYCGSADIYMIKGNYIYCNMRIYSNDIGENIYLEAYDCYGKQSYKSTENITFASNITMGRPGATQKYNFSAAYGKLGDINGDNVIDVSDVTALVDIILGNSETSRDVDVNGDGVIDISDVTALIDIILGI